MVQAFGQAQFASFAFLGDGAPGEIRTPDLMLRRHSLYPAELRAHSFSIPHFTVRAGSEPGLAPRPVTTFDQNRKTFPLEEFLEVHHVLFRTSEILHPAAGLEARAASR